MARRSITVVIAAILMLGIFSGCDMFHRADSFPGESTTVIPLERFTLNFIRTEDEDDRTQRFRHFVAEVAVEVSDRSLVRTFEERIHRVREIISTSISARTAAQLTGQAMLESLRQEIVLRLNEEFNTTAVYRVVVSESFFA